MRPFFMSKRALNADRLCGHCAITELIAGGMDSYHLVAKIPGTSTAMIDANYGHLRVDTWIAPRCFDALIEGTPTTTLERALSEPRALLC